MKNKIESQVLSDLNVSLQHKLNQPLMVINTSLEMLSKDMKNDKIMIRLRKELNNIHETLKTVDRIARENIELKRIPYVQNIKMIDLDGLMTEIQKRSEHYDSILNFKRNNK